MIYSHIAAGMIGAAIAAAGAWQTQNWRYTGQIAKIEKAYAASSLKAQEEATAKTKELQRQKDEAINDATKRAQRNAAAANAARADANSLRDQLAASRRELPITSCDAARNYAATLSDVFGNCTRILERISAEADGHASDSMMYQQSWPR